MNHEISLLTHKHIIDLLVLMVKYKKHKSFFDMVDMLNPWKEQVQMVVEHLMMHQMDKQIPMNYKTNS
jgi:hypothetical protein